MPTSLVTGAAGFIGSHVAHQLVLRGHRVIALDDCSGGHMDNVPDVARFYGYSCTDVQRIAQIFDREDFDFVFHLGAYAAEGLSHFIRRFNYTNNVLGSVTLINEAVRHDVRRFVFTSSMAVYGSNQVPMTEAMTPHPEDPYGIAKYAVELDLEAAYEMFGLNFTIFRPHNVYGERQNIGDRYRNVIGIFMNQLMADQPMTVFGDGLQTRAFSYIDDVAPLIAQCITIPDTSAGVFNVGADQPYTVLELAEAVAKAFGVEPRIEHLPPRVEVKHAYAAHDRVRAVYGERETVELADGLARMADWAKRTGPRRVGQFPHIEVLRNLPSAWASAGH